jgi:DNA topoisomerase-1
MSMEWFVRRGGRHAFRYLRASGAAVRDPRTLKRVTELRIPPAWRDVHVASNPQRAIQAWGIDARGRKQYIYHPRAVERREQRKHYRVRRLARDLPRIRAALYDAMAARALTRDRVAAGVVRCISKGFFRVGNERYRRENGTFGVATLEPRHVQVDGDVITFRFRGKSGKPLRQVLVDRSLARLVRELQRDPGRRLFRYHGDNGWRNLTAADVNEYVRHLTGLRYTAKDFRTWGATVRLATVLSELGPARSASEAKRNVTLAIRLVAAELGNTPAICRSSYVHPMVIGRYLDHGETILPRERPEASRMRRHHYPEERALIAFLDRHFPERRRRVRPDERVSD